jgi:GH25 family lysozyme M1 (1,4-beta-N-acetylmuramidase)
MAANLQEYFASALEADDNIIGTFTREDGTVVVLVQDDRPNRLAPHQLTIATSRTRGDAPKVTFEKTQPFVAWADPTQRHRPAPAGVSVAHKSVTAGTIGAVVRNKLSGKRCILSNNHVLANVNHAAVGDAVLQPGPADGGTLPNDQIGRLTDFIRLSKDNPNYADAAIAEVTDPDMVSLETLNLGFANGLGVAYLNQQIAKSGRTTRTTRGKVIAVDADVKVQYGPSTTYTIRKCIISDIYGGPGDSGSGIVDFITRQLLGLLFAGNDMYTIICQQQFIMPELDIELIEPPYKLHSGWLDLSHWNPIEPSVDRYSLDGVSAQSFPQIKAAGYEGVVLKVCQAGAGIDVRFEEYYRWAKAAGLKVTGYIFVDPAYSAQAHMDLFEQATVGKTFDLPPDIDAEKTASKTPQVITAVVSQLSEMLEAWYGSKPFIYSNLSFINTNLLPWNKEGVDQWSLHPLHLAYWSHSAYYPQLPKYWKTVHLWQVGPYEVGPAIGVGSKAVDLNILMPDGQKLLGGTEPPPGEKVSLTVTVSGEGTVSPSGGEYDLNSTVTLTAIPEDGWAFQNWSGDHVGSDNPLSLVMNADKTLTAAFVESDPGGYTYRKAKVVAPRGVNVRTGPGVTHPPYFAKPAGWVFEVIEEKPVGADLWVRVGCDQWVAYRYNGANLLEYV